MILDIQLCDKASTAETILIIKNILTVIRFAVPIILIIMSMIQIVKTVTSDKVDNRKLVASLAKKIIFAAIVFFIPTIINFAMGIAQGISLTKDDCWNKVTREYVKQLKDKEKKEQDDREKDRKAKIEAALSSMISNNSISSDSPGHADDFSIAKTFVVLAHIKKYTNLNSYTIQITDNQGTPMPASDFTFESDSPGIASVSADGTIKAKFGGTTSIKVTYNKDKKQSLKVKVTVIHSLYTKVKTTKGITATNLKTGQKVNLKKGTKGVYNGLAESGKLHRNYIGGDILNVDGNYYEVDVSNVKHYGYQIDNKKVDQATAEEFVNSHGFKSKTNYLFWSNQGAQYEYVFTGSKGNWKLDRVYPISSGDALGYSIGFNSKGNSGTGIYPKMYVMGTYIAKSYAGSSYPDGYIPKNNGSSGYHAYGGTRKPKTHGCTALKKKDLKWFTSNIKKIGGSQIVTI